MNPALLHPPYRAPRVRPGEQLYCEHHAADVLVAGTTDAPIPWPAYAHLRGLTPILTGDLARAVRLESVQAVAYWWGVSRDTVRRWRKKLGVGRFNEGTTARWRELVAVRLPVEARRRGARATKRRARAKA